MLKNAIIGKGKGTYSILCRKEEKNIRLSDCACVSRCTPSDVSQNSIYKSQLYRTNKMCNYCWVKLLHLKKTEIKFYQIINSYIFKTFFPLTVLWPLQFCVFTWESRPPNAKGNKQCERQKKVLWTLTSYCFTSVFLPFPWLYYYYFKKVSPKCTQHIIIHCVQRHSHITFYVCVVVFRWGNGGNRYL